MIPCAVANWKMTEFQQLPSFALDSFQHTVNSFKSDNKINSEIRKEWEAKKKNAVNVIIMGRDNRRLYQEAQNKYDLFVKKHSDIFKKYKELLYYYEDYTDFLTIFTDKTKPERFKERHKAIFNEATRLKEEVNRLRYYNKDEEELIRAVEQSYSLSSNEFRQFASSVFDRYRKDECSKIVQWRKKFNIPGSYQYLIRDLTISYTQPNVCHIICKRANFEHGPYVFSEYNEVIMNKELSIHK